MKLNEKLNRFCDRIDGFLHRFCGAMSPDTRLIVIVVMIIVFGGINIFLVLSSIYQAGRTDERKELMEIKHITPITIPDTTNTEFINPLTDEIYDRPEQKE